MQSQQRRGNEKLHSENEEKIFRESFQLCGHRMVSDEKSDILQGDKRERQSPMRAKKLLDQEAVHSEMLIFP